MNSAVLSWLALLAAAPLTVGAAARTRSFLTSRRGAPIWQLYADLWKLARRGVVYSLTTTLPFRLAPIAILVSTLLATLLLPADGRQAVVSFSGDAILLVYLLGLARFLLVLGALDTGSSFEGMGASRDVTFASLVEPGLLVSLVALSVASGQLSLTGMLGDPLWARWPAVAPAVILLAASVFALTLAECSRVPVDDPATHLELTMIHEVMVLDHSGPDLAMILYTNALKLGAFAVILLNLLVPRGQVSPWLAAPLVVVALLVVGAGVGTVEAVTARLRMPKVPLFIAGGGALGLFGLILVLH